MQFQRFPEAVSRGLARRVPLDKHEHGLVVWPARNGVRMRLGLWRRWLRRNSRDLKLTALVVLGGLSLTVFYSGQPHGAKAALLAILAATTAIYLPRRGRLPIDLGIRTLLHLVMLADTLGAGVFWLLNETGGMFDWLIWTVLAVSGTFFFLGLEQVLKAVEPQLERLIGHGDRKGGHSSSG